MTGFVDGLSLWPAQDALLAALRVQERLADAGTDLGQPVNVQPDHVWIVGGATGSLERELSGNEAPSSETFRLTVVVYTRLADDYPEVRDRLKNLGCGVEDALLSAGFAAVVPSWSIPEYRVEEGTDGTYREMSIELVIECRCW